MPPLVPIRATLTLDFDHAFHIGTSRADGLVNRTIRRTAGGRPLVPGSALKGALREAAERVARTIDERIRGVVPGAGHLLSARRRGAAALPGATCEAPHPASMCQSRTPCMVCRLFGNALTGTRLLIGDAAEAPPPFSTQAPGRGAFTQVRPAAGQVQSYTSVRIDRRRGGAAAGALFTSEYAPATRFVAELRGATTQTVLREGLPPVELVLLAGAISAVDQIGADASKGKGACRLTTSELQVRPRGEEPRSQPLPPLLAPLEDIALELTETPLTSAPES